jgi:hypothetical protein
MCRAFSPRLFSSKSILFISAFYSFHSLFSVLGSTFGKLSPHIATIKFLRGQSHPLMPNDVSDGQALVRLVCEEVDDQVFELGGVIAFGFRFFVHFEKLTVL